MSTFIRTRAAPRPPTGTPSTRLPGERVQHSKGGFKTKKAAREYLHTIMGKVQEGAWNPDQPVTVKQLLEDHWLPAQRTRELRPATLTSTATSSGGSSPSIGGVRASALTPKMVTDMVSELRMAKSAQGRDGLSARSAQLAVGVLKAAYVWAVANQLLGRNPIAGIGRPRSTSAVMKVWNADQAKAFLAHTAGDRLAFAWSLLLTRGLRRGELCGLRWDAVDLDGSVIRINRTRVVAGGKAIESIPKTAAGRRSVVIDAKLVAILQAHMRHPGGGEGGGRRSIRGRRLSGLRRARDTLLPGHHLRMVRCEGGRGWAPPNSVPRLPAHGGNPHAGQGRPGEGGVGDARPCLPDHHLVDLRPRTAWDG